MRTLTNNEALTLSAVVCAGAYFAYRNKLVSGKVALWGAVGITALGFSAAAADEAHAQISNAGVITSILGILI